MGDVGSGDLVDSERKPEVDSDLRVTMLRILRYLQGAIWVARLMVVMEGVVTIALAVWLIRLAIRGDFEAELDVFLRTARSQWLAGIALASAVFSLWRWKRMLAQIRAFNRRPPDRLFWATQLATVAGSMLANIGISGGVAVLGTIAALAGSMHPLAYVTQLISLLLLVAQFPRPGFAEELTLRPREELNA